MAGKNTREELASLARQLHASNRRAAGALDEALDAVDAALQEIRGYKATLQTAEHDEAVRASLE